MLIVTFSRLSTPVKAELDPFAQPDLHRRSPEAGVLSGNVPQRGLEHPHLAGAARFHVVRAHGAVAAIELKLGKFKAADKGQMELYLRWLAKYEQEPGEAPPLGIILCTGKNCEQIALLELDQSGT